MDKRYQIFISSTYADLEEERRLVMEAVIGLNCFPAGMEMFPSTDTNQLDYIKEVIKNSDYYVLILAGKYGSLAKDGISYTEKEYNYAKRIGIPILAFIRDKINDLPSRLVENDNKKSEKLKKFKEKVKKGRLVSFWNDPLELKYLIHDSLVKEFQLHPRAGWVKGQELAETKDSLFPEYNVNTHISINDFLNDKYVKRMLSDEKKIPLGYVANSGSVYCIDLIETYCFMISGRRQTGKTNTLKSLIEVILAKGDKVYIIDPDNKELENTFVNPQVTYVSTFDEIYDMFLKLVPMYKERNHIVLDSKNKGQTPEEIFFTMRTYPKIHIIIDDLPKLIDVISQKEGGKNLYNFLYKVVSKGRLHNLYFYFTLNQDVRMYDDLFKVFTCDKKGVHLGGEFFDERILSFNEIPYRMQKKITKKGVGYVKLPYVESNSLFLENTESFIIIPHYDL